MIEWGTEGMRDEFFVIKLADQNARAALMAYALQATSSDPELAYDVLALAQRAGPSSKYCKKPD